jgi:hypothetical protein
VLLCAETDLIMCRMVEGAGDQLALEGIQEKSGSPRVGLLMLFALEEVGRFKILTLKNHRYTISYFAAQPWLEFKILKQHMRPV